MFFLQNYGNWYFKLISMSKRRKLEADQDLEQFTPSAFINSLSETPECLSFESINAKKSHQTLKSSTETKNFKITLNENTEQEVIYSPSFNSQNELQSNRSLTYNQRKSRRRHQSSFRAFSEQQQLTLNKQFDQMQKSVDSKSRTCKLIFQNNNILEGIIKSQKIKKLKGMFIKKIMRTSTASAPVEFNLFSAWEKESLLKAQGIEIPQSFNNLLNLLSVFQIMSLLFIYSVSIAFIDLLGESAYISTLQLGSLLFYLVEIVLNLISIKSEAGKKVVIIEEIIKYYISRSFWVDVVSFFILLLDIFTNIDGICYLRLFIIFKLPACLQKIEKLQVYFIQNIYNEQYWQLAKVFIVNFCMAHVICILLASMAKINLHSNWMVDKGIIHAKWTEQYIWSYYWAANIMLTVGFGDIVASNSAEAICLIFIQTFSCIVMAYNINCMGTIITNIRSENDKRSKKFKIFKKLTNQNYVPQELEFQINNYIEQSSNLKKQFNYEEDRQFISELPQTLKVSYLKQSNKKILKNLVFFRDLLDRTLYNFAEHLQIRMTHPQQIIRNIDDDFNLMILKQGEIGYACKKHGCEFNDQIVDFIKVQPGEEPFLTGLDFISKVRPLYQIKSLKFSVLYQMDYNRFIEVFKESDMDYELFCFLRDKIRNIPDQFQVLPCEYCNKKFNHFKFTCPKLHYAPYSQHIIDKQLHREKIGKNKREKINRTKQTLLTAVQFYKKLKNYRNSPKMQIKHQQREFYQTFYQQGVKKVTKRNSILLSNSHQTRKKTKLPDQMTSDQLKEFIDSKAREVVEIQFLRREKKKEFQDQIWILNLDVLADFNSYFSQHNPHSLKEKFTPQKRLQQKFQKICNFQKIHYTANSPQMKTDAIKSLIGYLPSQNENSPK